jgi:hypothetical protein
MAAPFRRPVGLELNAEPVGDSVHIVEVGDDLVGVDDAPVVQPVGTEPVEVVLDDLCRRERQLGCVVEQRGEPRPELVDVAGDDRLRRRSVT